MSREIFMLLLLFIFIFFLIHNPVQSQSSAISQSLDNFTSARSHIVNVHSHSVLTYLQSKKIPQLSVETAPLMTTGTVNVPGGGKLSYTISAQKVPGTNKVSFWLDLVNNETDDITIIACAMLRLDKPNKMMPQYTVEKTNGSWVCMPDGKISRPPGFHFGCKRITVPKKTDGIPGTTQAFDVTGELDEPFQQRDIAAIYWDILKDCPLDSSCNVFNRANVNLTPNTIDVITNSANIWGGNWFRPECLSSNDDHCVDVAFWDVGNWITMEFPDFYPARITGEITGVPMGTSLTLTLPDKSPITYSNSFSNTIPISETFTIPPDHDAIATLRVNDPVIEGTIIRFEADVEGDIGNPIYEAGEFMYGVDINFFQDNQPPNIDLINIRPVSPTGSLSFQISSTDSATMPSAAALTTTVGSVQQITDLSFSDPVVNENGMIQFEGTVGPFPINSVVNYNILVVDTVGNVASHSEAIFVSFENNIYLPLILSKVS